MDKQELVYVRQALLGIKDWDVFQAVIRNSTRVTKAAVPIDGWLPVDKKGR